MKFQNIIKNKDDYVNLKQATQISVEILKTLRDNIKVNVSAGDINEVAGQLCEDKKVVPSFLGVEGIKTPYKYNLCISINDEILHSIPYKEKIFKNGDIIKVDFGIIHKGFYTDHCITIGLGNLTPREIALINTAKLCVDNAIEQAIVGNHVSDISYSLETVAELGRFDVVTTYCGHGIGKKLHLAPELPSYVHHHGQDYPLLEGMILCIENQITIGKADLKTDSDGWTLKTIDGSKGAMFEHMVIVKNNKPEILTLMD